MLLKVFNTLEVHPKPYAVADFYVRASPS